MKEYNLLFTKLAGACIFGLLLIGVQHDANGFTMANGIKPRVREGDKVRHRGTQRGSRGRAWGMHHYFSIEYPNFISKVIFIERSLSS